MIKNAPRRAKKSCNAIYLHIYEVTIIGALLLTACHTKHACAKFGVADWRTYRTDQRMKSWTNDWKYYGHATLAILACMAHLVPRCDSASPCQAAVAKVTFDFPLFFSESTP